MDVYVAVNPPKRFEWFVALRDGITLERNGREYKAMGLWVQPSWWGHLMKAPGITLKQRLANTKSFCVVGAETADGEEIPAFNRLSEQEMLRTPEDGGFSTYDAEEIDNSLIEKSPGPRLALATTCSKEHGGCGFEYEEAVDWRHEVFFTSSRRSSRRGRR
jgi:hypothetical protein